MPDFSNCVKDRNGVIWCYDKENNEVCQIIIEHPTPAMIPQHILLELLRKESEG
jgi:hypothetical protein